jgi:hypothetical protein
MQQSTKVSLKGQQMNICLKAYKIKSVLLVRAQTVFEFLVCLIKEKNY